MVANLEITLFLTDTLLNIKFLLDTVLQSKNKTTCNMVVPVLRQLASILDPMTWDKPNYANLVQGPRLPDKLLGRHQESVRNAWCMPSNLTAAFEALHVKLPTSGPGPVF